MSSHKKVESAVSEAAVIRAIWPGGRTKRLARLCGVPLGTAHEWLYRHLSAARQREIARALLAEMDRQDREERAAARVRLAEMAGIDAVVAVGDAMAGAGAGVAADPGAAAAAGSRRRRIARRLAEYARE